MDSEMIEELKWQLEEASGYAESYIFVLETENTDEPTLKAIKYDEEGDEEKVKYFKIWECT